MSEALIIRLPEQAHQPVAWLITDSSKQNILASGELADCSALNQLTERAKNRTVLLAVAGEAVSLYTVSLPTKASRQWPQLIPYALEEFLGEEIQNLHFAWPSRGDATNLPVLVVNHQQMTFWQKCLAEADIQAQQWWPDYLLLPYEAGVWSVAAFGENLTVRSDLWAGFCIEPRLFKASLGSLNELPEALKTFGEVPNFVETGLNISAAQVDLVLQTMLQMTETYSWGLCQGKYQIKTQKKHTWAFLKYPTQCAAALLVILLCYTLLQTHQYKQESKQTQAEIEAIYFELFPEQRFLPPDARRRVQALNAQLSGEQGDFLHFLRELESAFEQNDIELTVLQYDQARGELRIQATGASFKVFNTFQSQLAQQSIEVEQGQLVSRAGRIAGTLTVRRAYVD